MGGLWRNNDSTPGGKYLVQRRDGTIPEWPFIVIGARDPAAPEGLRAYADACERMNYDSEYVKDIRQLADDFESYALKHGHGDPTGKRHRQDDPEVVEKMKASQGA